jgi:hypothetical protein
VIVEIEEKYAIVKMALDQVYELALDNVSPETRGSDYDRICTIAALSLDTVDPTARP